MQVLKRLLALGLSCVAACAFAACGRRGCPHELGQRGRRFGRRLVHGRGGRERHGNHGFQKRLGVLQHRAAVQFAHLSEAEGGDRLRHRGDEQLQLYMAAATHSFTGGSGFARHLPHRGPSGARFLQQTHRQRGYHRHFRLGDRGNLSQHLSLYAAIFLYALEYFLCAGKIVVHPFLLAQRKIFVRTTGLDR